MATSDPILNTTLTSEEEVQFADMVRRHFIPGWAQFARLFYAYQTLKRSRPYAD